ncbi:archaeosortase/exosortase family protein [Pedobacter sp. PF22-3]|jgi:exosortase/archaeosortase family protein|uniref:exosortase Y n=1 Tax=Pedobacter sp. PF22-3 TaxID=2994467 RepID=UPI0022472523|nr:archaeosortase/exosortase family protein [Pedobacter sp. PF22-3]MCX2492596.1 archaeosortase/exosortase family protein [Pedobacter sp. PF22-3]
MNPEQAKKEANKKAIKFLIALFILYILFSQGNLFMLSVMTPGSKFYNAYIAEHFNYIQGLKTALIVPAVWIIKAFGFYAIYNEMDVMVVAGPYLRINYSCLGLGVMSFLAAFVLSFPASWKSTFKMLFIGILIIYILNILRIAGLGILMAVFKSQRNNFNYHHEIFNIIVYICVFTMLYFWIKRNNKSKTIQP